MATWNEVVGLSSYNQDPDATPPTAIGKRQRKPPERFDPIQAGAQPQMKKKRKTPPSCNNTTNGGAQEGGIVIAKQPPAKKQKKQHEGEQSSKIPQEKEVSVGVTEVATPKAASNEPQLKENQTKALKPATKRPLPLKEKQRPAPKPVTKPNSMTKQKPAAKKQMDISPKRTTTSKKDYIRLVVRVKRMFAQTESGGGLEALCNFAKHKLFSEEFVRARFDHGLFEFQYPSKTNTKKRKVALKLNQQSLASAVEDETTNSLFSNCKEFWEYYSKYNTRAAFARAHKSDFVGKPEILLQGRYSYGVPTQYHKCYTCESNISPDTILFWHTQNKELANTFFCASCVEHVVYHLEKNYAKTLKKRETWVATVISTIHSQRKETQNQKMEVE